MDSGYIIIDRRDGYYGDDVLGLKALESQRQSRQGLAARFGGPDGGKGKR